MSQEAGSERIPTDNELNKPTDVTEWVKEQLSDEALEASAAEHAELPFINPEQLALKIEGPKLEPQLAESDKNWNHKSRLEQIKAKRKGRRQAKKAGELAVRDAGMPTVSDPEILPEPAAESPSQGNLLDRTIIEDVATSGDPFPQAIIPAQPADKPKRGRPRKTPLPAGDKAQAQPAKPKELTAPIVEEESGESRAVSFEANLMEQAQSAGLDLTISLAKDDVLEYMKQVEAFLSAQSNELPIFKGRPSQRLDTIMRSAIIRAMDSKQKPDDFTVRFKVINAYRSQALTRSSYDEVDPSAIVRREAGQ